MRAGFAVIIVLVIGLVAAPPAHAWRFGADEELHPLVDVGVQLSKGEPLVLGFKTTIRNFVLPYALSDDGYVLIVKGTSDRYYDLPEERIQEWQEAGLLPSPLPKYEVPLIERIFSYALYAAIVLILLLYAVPAIRRRGETKAG